MSPRQRARAALDALRATGEAIPAPAKGVGQRATVVGLGAAIVAGLALALVVAGPALAAEGGTTATPDIEPDTVLLDVTIEPDGDADWTVAYRVRLDDDNATAAFESVAADVDADPTNYSAAFEERMRRTVEAAANATGREMALRNLTVSTRQESLPQATGVVVYRFEWTGFAGVADGTLEAGDAIDQLYLDADTRLSISWPSDYHRTSVAPEATRTEDTEVVWAGPLAFDPGEPRVVVAPGAPAGDGGSGVLGSPAALLLAALLAGLLVAGLVVAARRRDWSPLESGEEETPGGPAAATPAAAGPAEGADGDDDAGTAGAGAAAADAAGPASGGDETVPETPPEELLSNEERVLKLVREAGGRMKQQAVAEELDWTAAKTSQVVGTLRDDEELDAFRLGRENVLRLPGDDPLGPPAGDEDQVDDEATEDERADDDDDDPHDGAADERGAGR